MTALIGKEVARGLRFPEGPLVRDDGSLLCVEMEAGTLTAVRPDGRKEVVAHLGGGPNGAAIGPDGACYVCNNGGVAFTEFADGLLRPTASAPGHPGGSIQRVDLTTGRVDLLYQSCDGLALRGPNDLVFDGTGGFWFTDMGKVVDRVIHRGAVYYARTDGSRIVEAVYPIFTPNGIGLSPDGKTLYVAETDTARLWSFPILGAGQVAMEPWPSPNGGRLIWGAGGYQRFDSLAVEAAGNVCVATLLRGGITVCSPEGQLVAFHEAPEPFCTNLCFGGEQLRTAFITLSGTGRILAVDWPRPGLALAF